MFHNYITFKQKYSIKVIGGNIQHGDYNFKKIKWNGMKLLKDPLSNSTGNWICKFWYRSK